MATMTVSLPDPMKEWVSGEADVRTVVDTARLSGAKPFGTILRTVSA